MAVVVTDATQATEAELLEASSHFFPSSEGFKFKRCTGGVNNKTFYADSPAGTRYVLRIYNNGGNLPRVVYEHAVLHQLKGVEFSFQIPRFLPSVKDGASFGTMSSGAQTCCAYLIEGVGAGNEAARAIGCATAELVTKMAEISHVEAPPANPLYRNFYAAHHSITRDTFFKCAEGPDFDNVRESMNFLLNEIKKTESLIAAIVAMDPPLPTQLINADLHTDNVLVSADQKRVTGVLDFEFCANDWRVMELVVGVSKYCGAKDPKPLLEEYIAGYKSGGGFFTKEEILLVPELIILRVLNNVVFFVGRYLANEDSIEPISGRASIYASRIAWLRSNSVYLQNALSILLP